MPIKVDPHWWQTLFDEVYLVTDARTVCNHELTCREVDLYTQIVECHPSDVILDLCGGQGRHAMELCRRGILQCTVFDFSRALLDIGMERAEQAGYPVRFVQGDARNTHLPENVFDKVFILGNSLGYIHEAEADFQILKEALRVLRPGGTLLIDISDGEAVRRQFTPNAWHEIGEDIVVCRQRDMDGDVLCAREMVISKTKGLIRDKTYGIRLYAPSELLELVSKAGFDKVERHQNFTGRLSDADVGCMKHRVVVSAVKPRKNR